MKSTRSGVGYSVFLLALAVSGCATSDSQYGNVHLELGSKAASRSSHHGVGASHDSTSVTRVPTLSGQYVFATIGEVVALLEADAATDWSTVNLEALRQHLIDMDRVTMDASVAAQSIENGARFVVTSSDTRAQSSIRRMVSAHAETLSNELVESDMTNPEPAPWQYLGATVDDGMSLTVTASDENGGTRIRALGFIGLMVSGSHHPSHHWALATGKDPHLHNH